MQSTPAGWIYSDQGVLALSNNLHLHGKKPLSLQTAMSDGAIADGTVSLVGIMYHEDPTFAKELLPNKSRAVESLAAVQAYRLDGT